MSDGESAIYWVAKESDAAISFIVLATLFTTFRFSTRWTKDKVPIWWDDYLIIPGFVVIIALCALFIGKHSSTCPSNVDMDRKARAYLDSAAHEIHASRIQSYSHSHGPIPIRLGHPIRLCPLPEGLLRLQCPLPYRLRFPQAIYLLPLPAHFHQRPPRKPCHHLYPHRVLDRQCNRLLRALGRGMRPAQRAVGVPAGSIPVPRPTRLGHVD